MCFVVPIECKQKNFKTSIVLEQLQSGTNFATELIEQVEGFHLYPILVSGSIKPAERKKLREARIIHPYTNKDFKITKLKIQGNLVATLVPKKTK